MEKKDVVRNIIISANDFKFKEINGVEFETAVKYYIDQLESVQPEPAMPKIADLATEVKNDIEGRIQKGVETYRERLKVNNGRIALQDAYEEILDLALYIKQELKEREKRDGDKITGWGSAAFSAKKFLQLVRKLNKGE